MTDKFCKDCKYFISGHMPDCAHPKTRRPEFIDLVTGETSGVGVSCALQRSYTPPDNEPDAYCTRNALWFEPK